MQILLHKHGLYMSKMSSKQKISNLVIVYVLNIQMPANGVEKFNTKIFTLVHGQLYRSALPRYLIQFDQVKLGKFTDQFDHRPFSHSDSHISDQPSIIMHTSQQPSLFILLYPGLKSGGFIHIAIGSGPSPHN